jgi:hypothetical protein
MRKDISDWAVFTEAVPCFLDRSAVVEVTTRRTTGALSELAATLFPHLADLLAKAAVTDVSVNGRRYELLAWDSPDGDRLGWLCLPPSEDVPSNLHDDHKKLLACFGGIVERFNEPEDTWLLNLNDALTEREASHDASFIHDYSWADAGLTLPIEPSEYYSIASEANGNETICHRVTGHVLMFAQDHCFDHLTKLEGCPEYTLYRINGADSFRDWVNMVALQWLDHAGRSA